MENKKEILGMPVIVFLIVSAVLVIGIVIGSFMDLQISQKLSNLTDPGDFFQKYGNILSHCMYPVGGICIFKGIKKKNKGYSTLAWGILIFTIFWTFYSFLDVSGEYLRAAYGYKAGDENTLFTLLLTFLSWVALASIVAFIANKLIGDARPEALIAAGSVIILGGMFGEYVNEWLKAVGCRPRYKYLITLDDPAKEFKNWWEMMPYLKDESSFRSWPSGHMTKATVMFTLPMLAGIVKPEKKGLKYFMFAIAVAWVCIFGYNRIHMNAHFLTDVCFGVLITYCIYALIYKCAFSAVSIMEINNKAKNKNGRRK